jgi:hypothetical protein
MSYQDLAAAIHRAAFLKDINAADDLARLARVPTSVVLDALRTGELPGREFSGLGWRVTKRAALSWIEAREAQEASDAVS